MRRLIAVTLAAILLVGILAPTASAGTATNVALGLASFAVLNQLFGPVFYPRPVYATPVVAPAPVVYAAYPTLYTAPTV